MEFTLLLFMIFCHIVDDYYLQGWLANAKQKSYWENSSQLYKNDYKMVLFIHSFSWTFMIMLPTMLCSIVFGGKIYPLLYLINIIIHFITDDLKANKRRINLIQDQLIHLMQIIITWGFYLFY